MKRGKRGFTLYELILSIALFLLVAGLVIAFITFMQTFSQNNQRNAARARQVYAIRQEIDFWMAWFDDPAYTLQPSVGESAMQATHNATGQVFEVKLQLVPDEEGNFQRKLVLTFPNDQNARGEEVQVQQNGQTVALRQLVLDAHLVAKVHFTRYSPPVVHVSEANSYLRFVVHCPVTQQVFACDLTYDT